jgi:hypothetical protein
VDQIFRDAYIRLKSHSMVRHSVNSGMLNCSTFELFIFLVQAYALHVPASDQGAWRRLKRPKTFSSLANSRFIAVLL